MSVKFLVRSYVCHRVGPFWVQFGSSLGPVWVQFGSILLVVGVVINQCSNKNSVFGQESVCRQEFQFRLSKMRAKRAKGSERIELHCESVTHM